MGCASSKKVEAAVVDANVYRPPPTSIALFDINTIEEPWLIITTTTTAADDQKLEEDKNIINNATLVPLPILDKLDSGELAPQSWSEVSKALDDLKPSLQQHQKKPPPIESKPPASTPNHKTHNSIHTLEELHAKISSPKKPINNHDVLQSPPLPPPQSTEVNGYKPVRDNMFILRDRQERESMKDGGHGAPKFRRRDPFEGYQEYSPPGNPNGLVLYVTTLRGVRRTFEDCETMRRAVEAHAMDAGVAVDERDVALHGEYLRELRELLGEGATVPKLFVGGRYVGGAAEEVVELADTGRLKEMLRWMVRRGGGGGEWKGECEGCGGRRFLNCLECKGSCKVVGEGKEVVRCDKCNENGLVHCPLCH